MDPQLLKGSYSDALLIGHSPTMVRNLVNKSKNATGQASLVIIDATRQKKDFTRDVAEETLKGLKR